MASGAQTLPLLARIGHPRIKVAYDTGNCEFYGDVKAVDDIATMVPYLANVHLKDKRGGKGVWDFPEPGAGTVDFGSILRQLDEAGYSGPALGRDRVPGRAVAAARRGRCLHEAGLRAPERARPGMIGVAILGGGFMGQTHAAAWAALAGRARVVAVSSRTQERAARVAAICGG